MRCLVPVLTAVPAGDWFCPGCAAKPLPPRPPGRRQQRLPGASYDHVACRVCARQDGEAFMLLCDGCDEGFHMRRVGVPGRRTPAGDWFCPGFTALPVAHTLPLLATRPQREGSWRSRFGLDRYYYYYYY
jgi:hypothetical protein